MYRKFRTEWKVQWRARTPLDYRQGRSRRPPESHSLELRTTMRRIALLSCAWFIGCSSQNANPISLAFNVPPLVAGADRPNTRIDSIWSPNDDRDTVRVLLSGGPSRGRLDVAIEITITRIVGVSSKGAGPSVTPVRTATWQLPSVSLDSVAFIDGRRAILILHPSSVTIGSPVALAADENVGLVTVRVTAADGRSAMQALRLLPGI